MPLQRSQSRAQVMVTDRPPPLEAWMHKKNKNGKSFLGGFWSKRWVSINDERGRLHIGKKAGKEGTTVFSLSELSSIRSLDPLSKEADGELFCFTVSQPPLSVVLRCRDDDERRHWVSQLERRSEHWRQKRRDEMQGDGLSVAVTAVSQTRTSKSAEAPAAATTGPTTEDTAENEPDVASPASTTSPTHDMAPADKLRMAPADDNSDSEDDDSVTSTPVITLS